MKRFIILFVFLFLAACSNTHHNDKISSSTNNVLFPISTEYKTGILVAVSDPHIYSKKGPLVISGSYYFDPRSFYYPALYVFSKAYSKNWNDKKVFYYDENGGAQAGLVVYVLKNYYHLNNVSVLINSGINQRLKFNQKFYSITGYLDKLKAILTGGYIGTGKYLVVYNPSLIKFETGDLLLYSCDAGTMKLDPFYKKYHDKIAIKSFYWSKMLTLYNSLKDKKEISKLLQPLHLENYKRVFIYYPKYWYRSGLLALYLQYSY